MQPTKWLTISESSVLCSRMSLSRTSKTIRSWARNGHVEARKKSTAHGDMWILDKASLLTKIQTEIEYRDQAAAVQTRVNESAPVQTSTDPSEPVQTRSGQPESENGQEQSSYEGSNTSEPGSHGSDQNRQRLARRNTEKAGGRA